MNVEAAFVIRAESEDELAEIRNEIRNLTWFCQGDERWEMDDEGGAFTIITESTEYTTTSELKASLRRIRTKDWFVPCETIMLDGVEVISDGKNLSL